MNIYSLISLPLIGAIIGWVTNWLAVKLLFRPYRPVSLLGYRLQGVIPKRRKEIAKSIGQVVDSELLSIDDLFETIKSKEVLDRISLAAADSIRAKIIQKFPAYVPMSLKRVISDIIVDQIKMEIPHIVTESFNRFSGIINDKVSFEKIVEEKVNNFSLERLEEVVRSVSAKELRHIEVLGGVLGFIIGFIQTIIIFFTT